MVSMMMTEVFASCLDLLRVPVSAFVHGLGDDSTAMVGR